MFPNPVGLTSEANTLELASTVGFKRLPLEPALMVAYDVGAINGTYLEGRLRQAVPVTKGGTLVLSARAGWSVRQQVDSAPAAFAPYERDGFTHLDLSVGAVVTVAGAVVTPYLTYTYVPDPLATAEAPGRQERDRVVFGTSVALSGKFPRPKSAAK